MYKRFFYVLGDFFWIYFNGEIFYVRWERVSEVGSIYIVSFFRLVILLVIGVITVNVL